MFRMRRRNPATTVVQGEDEAHGIACGAFAGNARPAPMTTPGRAGTLISRRFETRCCALLRLRNGTEAMLQAAIGYRLQDNVRSSIRPRCRIARPCVLASDLRACAPLSVWSTHRIECRPASAAMFRTARHNDDAAVGMSAASSSKSQAVGAVSCRDTIERQNTCRPHAAPGSASSKRSARWIPTSRPTCRP